MAAIVQNIILEPCCPEHDQILVAVENPGEVDLTVGTGYISLDNDKCYIILSIEMSLGVPLENFPGAININQFNELFLVSFQGCENTKCLECEQPEPDPDPDPDPEPVVPDPNDPQCCPPEEDIKLCFNIFNDDASLNGTYLKQPDLYNDKPYFLYQFEINGGFLYSFIVFDGEKWLHFISNSPFNALTDPDPDPELAFNQSDNLINPFWESLDNPSGDLISLVTFCCNEAYNNYYAVQNCLNPEIIFILQTPINSNYSSNQVLSFDLSNTPYENLVNCWTVVQKLDNYIDNVFVICLEITDCFSNCDSCLPSVKCTRAINQSNVRRTLSYRDFEGNIQETKEIVGIGKTSKKYCVLEWLSSDIEVIEFGDCINNECPEIPRPKPFVAPGYNSPICTTDQYERIVCRYSENKYRELMDKRFGIENCCPDDSISNDIKYELIHLQILEDPNYECTTSLNSCDSKCGYISLNRPNVCNNNESENNEDNINNDERKNTENNEENNDTNSEESQLPRPNIPT